MFLKLSLWKGVLSFGKKGKLSPRYIRPFEILDRVSPAAYKLALPMEMPKVHNVCHVLVLRKYVLDSTHVLEVQSIKLREDLSYEEEPIQVLHEKETSTKNEGDSVGQSFVEKLWCRRSYLGSQGTNG